MKRRYIIGLLGSSLGGCISNSSNKEDTASNSRLPLSVTLDAVHRDTIPREISVDITVTESEITESNTSQLEITYENACDKEIEIRAGKKFPFHTKEDEAQRWGLLYESESPNKLSADCWEPEDEAVLARELSIHTHILEPGEMARTERQLWSHPESDECMPTGESTFLTSHSVQQGGQAKKEFEWGFDLLIELR